jgi:mannose-1-phosphate guanylyltransferase
MEHIMPTQTTGIGGLWSIILAAGNGRGIDPFVSRWLGRSVPKEYCAFVGGRSMFQHALDRAEQVTPSDRLIAVVPREHRQEAFQQLDRRTIGALLLQPLCQGSAASVLLPLTYVRERDPDATVVVFPSDHFVYPEKRFLAQVRQAVSVVHRLPDRVVLMGVSPDRLELDYGWIAAGHPLPGPPDEQVRGVRSLVERPSASEADSLLQTRGLWNTRAFAATVRTIWEIGWKTIPHLMPLFERLGEAIGCPNEALEREAIFRKVSTEDFSQMLGQATDRLAVFELTGVLWSEWNRPERIAETLRRIDREPAFPLTCLDRPFIPFAPPAAGHEIRPGLTNEIHAIAERALHHVRSKQAPLSTQYQPGAGGSGPQEATEANIVASV